MGLKFRRGTNAQKSGSLAFGEPYVNTDLGTLQIGGLTGDITLGASGTGSQGSFAGISGSSLDITGNAKIDGNLILGGTITIGDAPTDNVVVNADLSSSIIPNDDNAFDLGSTSKRYRAIHSTNIYGTINATNGVISSSAQIKNYGDFATTGSNTFDGLQHINGAIEIHSGSNPEIRLINTTTGIEYHIQNGDGGNFQIHNGTNEKLLFLFQSASLAEGNQDGYFFGNLSVSKSISSPTITRINTFTGSANTRLTNLENRTGSLATTGSNTFLGNQTIIGSGAGFAAYISTSVNDATLGLDTTANVNAMYFLKNGEKNFELSYDTTNANGIFRLLPYDNNSFFEIGNPSNSGANYVFISEPTYGNVLIGPGIGNGVSSLVGSTPATDKVQVTGNLYVSGAISANSFTGSIAATNGVVSGSSQVVGILSSLNTYTGSLNNAIQLTGSTVSFLGDIVVYGTQSIINSTNLAVNDNLIYLNEGSTITNPDLGIVGNYNDGVYAHSGIFRDASDGGTWKVFEGYTSEPSGTINTNGNGFTLADFKADVITGTSFIATSSTASFAVPSEGKFASSLDALNHYVPHNGIGTSILRTGGADKILIGYGSAGEIRLSGSVTAPQGITAALTGNASTATTLQTARTINGTSFNGSSDITIANLVSGSSQVVGILSSLNTYTGSNDTTNTAQSARLTTIESVTGSYETKGRGIVSGSAQIDGSLLGSNKTITVGSTAITLGGTATTIAGLTSVTSTGFTGALTGNASTVTNGVYTTDTGTVTNTMLAGSIADTKLSTISTAGKVSNSATTATSANTFSAIVARDVTGNFTATTITAALSGNASTATTLQTARNINGVSFNGSADITVTAAAGTLSGATLASGVTASSLTSVGTLTSLTVTGAITANGGIAVTGALTATGDITAYYSDGRLKENLQVIPNALEKVSKLTGYTYNTNALGKQLLNNENDNDIKVGVIAQDLQEVLPQAVKFAPFDRDAEGNSKSGENYLTVQYEKIVPLLIEAIKEQQTQIHSLTIEIEKLKESKGL